MWFNQNHRHDDDSYKKVYSKFWFSFLFVPFVMHFRSASHSFSVLISCWLHSESKSMFIFCHTTKNLLSTECCSSSTSTLSKIGFDLLDFFHFFSLLDVRVHVHSQLGSIRQVSSQIFRLFMYARRQRNEENIFKREKSIQCQQICYRD